MAGAEAGPENSFSSLSSMVFWLLTCAYGEDGEIRPVSQSGHTCIGLRPRVLRVAHCEPLLVLQQHIVRKKRPSIKATCTYTYAICSGYKFFDKKSPIFNT